jgi:hypothetical protein
MIFKATIFSSPLASPPYGHGPAAASQGLPFKKLDHLRCPKRIKAVMTSSPRIVTMPLKELHGWAIHHCKYRMKLTSTE